MGKSKSATQLRLYRLCDEALYWIWDPVGVRGAPSARDEYYVYLPRAFELVQRGDEQAIVKYLDAVARQRMAMGANPHIEARANAAAEFMLAAKHWVEQSSPEDAVG
jgi:hypothetical protein